MYFHIPGSEQWLLAILRNRKGRAIVGTLTCVATTLLAVLMVPIELQSIDLARHHVETDAELRDTHEFTSSEPFSGTTYSIQYAFRVNGQWYMKRRPFGLGWSDLPKDEYDRVQRDGHVRVIYDPRDPWNNDLARNAGTLVAWAVVWIAGLGGTAAAAWVWVARIAADEVRRLFRTR